MSSDYFILWQRAIEVELDSMYCNRVWDLIEALEEIKPIRCKCVYKMKKWVDGKIETYKVRMVVKGYSQKPSFDYEKTFSLIVILKSIRILLSIMVHLNYEI